MRVRTAGIGLGVGALVLGGVVLPASAAPAELRVTTAADTVDVAPGDEVCADADGECSLRAAVMEANALAGQQRIRLVPATTYRLGLAGAGEDQAATGDLDVEDRLVVIGRGAAVDAEGLGDRAFDIRPGARLSALDLAVTGGRATGEAGGAFRATDALLQARRLVVSDSSSDVEGGAVATTGGQLRLQDSTVRDSTAPTGGGIRTSGTQVAAAGLTVTGNQAGGGGSRAGGGIATTGGTLTARDSTVAGNSVTAERRARGGGLSLDGTPTSVTDTAVTGNTAVSSDSGASGGGVRASGAVLRLERVQLADNRAEGQGFFPTEGGGVSAAAGNRVKVLDSEVTRNTVAGGPRSSGFGGGVAVDGATGLVRNSFVTDNGANNGGGLSATEADLVVQDSRVAGNSADGGGGAQLFRGRLVVQRSVLEDNQAGGGGGALLTLGGNVNIADSQIRGNRAGSRGAGLFSEGGFDDDDGLIQVIRTDFSENATSGDGGAVYAGLGSEFRAVASSFVSNSAGRAGGAVYAPGVPGILLPAGRAVIGQSAFAGNSPRDLFRDSTVRGDAYVLVNGVLAPLGPSDAGPAAPNPGGQPA